MRKQYGASKTENCPFCGKRALATNSQGVPVCSVHKKQEILDTKCACGQYMDLLAGKWGPYFNCLKCGNISFSKGMALNPKPAIRELEENQEKTNSIKTKKNPFVNNFNRSSKSQNSTSERKEIVVTSDELDFLYC